MAEIVSPPPARENPLDFAIDFASNSVPWENCEYSKTPKGPFHSMVLALLTIATITFIDFGPKSKIISSGII